MTDQVSRTNSPPTGLCQKRTARWSFWYSASFLFPRVRPWCPVRHSPTYAIQSVPGIRLSV